MVRSAGGIGPSTAAAATSLGNELLKNMPLSVGGYVCAGEPAESTRANVNSFQQPGSEMTAQVATAGADIGSTTRANAPKRESPSIRAAASTLRGSEAENPL